MNVLYVSSVTNNSLTLKMETVHLSKTSEHLPIKRRQSLENNTHMK